MPASSRPYRRPLAGEPCPLARGIASARCITAASELTLGAFDKTQVYRVLRKPLVWSELMWVIRTCLANV